MVKTSFTNGSTNEYVGGDVNSVGFGMIDCLQIVKHWAVL
jgi:hypothetical protein